MIVKVLIFNNFHVPLQHYFLLFISVKALNYICSDLSFYCISPGVYWRFRNLYHQKVKH